MKYKMKRLIILFVLCVGLSACGTKQEEDSSGLTVYEFGGEEISYGEYYIYAKTVEEDYRKMYGNGVWSLEINTDDGESTVKDITVQDIISSINRVKVLNAQQEEQNVSLTESERADIKNMAYEFFSGLTKQDVEDTQITLEIVEKVIEENMIAKRVYAQVIADYDFEISEEEARMSTFYDMVFECYSLEKDGSVKEYDEGKKAEQLNKANEALSALARDEGVTFDSIVDKYHLKYASSYTMSKTELSEEYGEAVAEKILALGDGEVSTIIQTQYGYHIFKMMQSNDKELTKKNKESIITQKQKEYFSGVYENWLKEYDSGFSIKQSVNMELAGRFPFTEEEETK